MSAGADTTVSLNVYWQRSVVFDENGRAQKGSGELTWRQTIVQDVLGIYHVGVDVHGVEYTFGNSHAPFSTRLGGTAGGVVTHRPAKAGPQNVLKESIQMGVIHLSQKVVEQTALLLSMSRFSRDTYNRYQHNCVDFAKEFLSRLQVGTEVPAWCCRGSDAARLAGLGRDECKETPRMTQRRPFDKAVSKAMDQERTWANPTGGWVSGQAGCEAHEDFADSGLSSASTSASSADWDLVLDDFTDDGIRKAYTVCEFTDASVAEEDNFSIPDDESKIQRVMEATWGDAHLRPWIENLFRENCESLLDEGSGAYCQMKAMGTRDVAKTVGMSEIAEIMAGSPRKSLDPHHSLLEEDTPPSKESSLPRTKGLDKHMQKVEVMKRFNLIKPDIHLAIANAFDGNEADSDFDGEWYKDGKLKAVVDGETIQIDGLDFGLSFPTPTTVRFWGRHDLLGHLICGNRSIKWTNGSVWHKQAFAVEEPLRPIEQSLIPSTWQKNKRRLMAAKTVQGICVAKHEILETTSSI
jgi:hypothetical protein